MGHSCNAGSFTATRPLVLFVCAASRVKAKPPRVPFQPIGQRLRSQSLNSLAIGTAGSQHRNARKGR